ncbi:hypothetical protein J1N35_007587 [Gossypium stocksii]|uniref:Aminotransferase-like plant mobile domain-containing protein n=1 Tax=Gossypium stocksii TaxID=47602 RepID=A0A9D4AFE0_9ROSI|nr:hypothetical protein J1N35_007587 [Gossypium stocksii]
MGGGGAAEDIPKASQAIEGGTFWDFGAAAGEYRVLRGHVHGSSYRPNEHIFLYLDVVGFGTTTLIRTFALRADLISALVERLRSKTHICRLPCEECTITLKDVALQLRLSVNGTTVTGSSDRTYVALLSVAWTITE